MRACSAHIAGGGFCTNGFPQTTACRGDATCGRCGNPSKAQPVCLRDELPKHLIDDSGRMLFAAKAQEGK